VTTIVSRILLFSPQHRTVRRLAQPREVSPRSCGQTSDVRSSLPVGEQFPRPLERQRKTRTQHNNLLSNIFGSRVLAPLEHGVLTFLTAQLSKNGAQRVSVRLAEPPSKRIGTTHGNAVQP